MKNPDIGVIQAIPYPLNSPCTKLKSLHFNGKKLSEIKSVALPLPSTPLKKATRLVRHNLSIVKPFWPSLITTLLPGKSDYLIFAYFHNIHLERDVKCIFVITSLWYLHENNVCGSSFYLIWFGFSYFMQEKALYFGTMCVFLENNCFTSKLYWFFFVFN